MLEPGQTVFIILSFEGPDVYSQAGGLGVRVKELSRALAERGYETHLFFVGDPNLPAHEALLDGRLTLHRWSQWISRFYPLGVYSGEDDKVADLNRSLPDALLKDYIRPAVERGNQVVVIGEEWHLAHAMTLISDALYFAGLRERCLLSVERQQPFLVSPDQLGHARLYDDPDDGQPLHEAHHVALGRQPDRGSEWHPRIDDLQGEPGAGADPADGGQRHGVPLQDRAVQPGQAVAPGHRGRRPVEGAWHPREDADAWWHGALRAGRCWNTPASSAFG